MMAGIPGRQAHTPRTVLLVMVHASTRAAQQSTPRTVLLVMVHASTQTAQQSTPRTVQVSSGIYALTAQHSTHSSSNETSR